MHVMLSTYAKHIIITFIIISLKNLHRILLKLLVLFSAYSKTSLHIGVRIN